MYGSSAASATTKKLMTVVGGAVVLLIIGVVFVNILGSSDKSNAQGLLDLAAQQQEIIRVAGLGLAQAAISPDSRNFALTAQLSLQSSQKGIMSMLKLTDPKKTAASLGAKFNAQTDAQLTSALQNSTYDGVFIQIMNNDLKVYSVSLQTAYKKSKTATEKKIIQDSFNGVTLLLNDQAIKN